MPSVSFFSEAKSAGAKAWAIHVLILEGDEMKKATKECFCACCRSPRKLRYSRYLSKIHFAQILVITVGFTAATFPWLSWKGAMALPIIWGVFESVHKSLYRKDLMCPFCGFDPKWYKKDVKLARQKVEDFLKQNPESPVLRRARSEENSHSKLN
jgi:hypothetical protein